ncbi:hypothetical protein LSPH24S_10103 [Lysinibacillus sphaericus]
MNTADIEFGYCTEIMVRFEEDKEPFSEEQFRNELNPLGDSLLVISDEEIAKVHIHFEQPGAVLAMGQNIVVLLKSKLIICVSNIPLSLARITKHLHQLQRKKLKASLCDCYDCNGRRCG